MMRALALPVLAVMIGCNQHVAVIDSPAGPSPASPVLQHGVGSVVVSRGFVDGGQQVTGTVFLTGQAAPPGVTVALSSSDAAATVPDTVAIALGNSHADFTVTTRLPPEDRMVVISASTPERTASTILQVWSADPPMFFRFFSEPGDFIGRGDFGRFAPTTSRFEAYCDRSQVDIRVTTPGPEFWSVFFSAPEARPLRAGVYEEATGSPADRSRPVLRVGGRSRGCNTSVGRFQIHDVDLQNNRVNRFHASFEQRCINNGAPAWLRGDVRVLDAARSTSTVNCLQ